MATVEKTSRVRNVAEASRRVLDPLQRLRGYIRLYVSLEATAIVLLCIFTCFWLSFAFDYGAFKLPFSMSIDWVQVVPWTPVRELFHGSFVEFVLGSMANVMRVVPLVGLTLLLLILVASKAINRLLQRFRDTALALELERRFPKILGDRLITAVELSNRHKVAEQGYSTAMVDETIVEAAQRVEKLPIKEVFNWKRLWVMGFLIFFLTVVMYFFMAAGFVTAGYFLEKEGPTASFSDYNDILGIWFERNVLMQNTIWPRKAHLVFIEPEDAHLRIGRDKQPPPIRVRAWEYVFADTHAREGWRLLAWKDLEDTKLKLLSDQKAAVAPGDWKLRDPKDGLTVDEVALFFRKHDIRKGENPVAENDVQMYHFPGGVKLPYQWAIADSTVDEGWRPLAWENWEKIGGDYLNNFTLTELPTGWKPPLTPSIGYTFDEVEAAMANIPAPDLGDVRNVLAQIERLNDMRKTIDHLEPRIADPAMRRTMRKLIVPATVIVNLSGPTTRNTITLERKDLSTNDYTGTFPELKERNPGEIWTFEYSAHGEDYTTPTRKLTSMPPPTLINLSREDDRPAYLYYLPGGANNPTTADLKGKKQPLERSSINVSGGDVVTLDCPAGTDLTLYGEADKPLKSVKFTRPAERKPPVELVDEKGRKLATMTMPAAIDYVKKELTERNLTLARRTYLADQLAKFLAVAAPAAPLEPEPEVTLDPPSSFHVTLPNLRQDRTYEVEMLNTDNVLGTRKIKIRVTRDNEPSVDVAIADWIRKNKDGVMVTPKARIPFTGNIKDDNGLAKVNYVYTVAKIESTADQDVKALLASCAVGMMAPDGGSTVHGSIFLAERLRDYEKAKSVRNPDSKEMKFYPAKERSIASFETQLRNRPDQFLPLTTLAGLLGKRQPAGFRSLFKEFKVEPDPMEFDYKTIDPVIGDFPLTVADLLAKDDKVQQSYRITLWVEATDNDLDSTKGIDGADGPKTGTSKERFSLFVVPEEELMLKIGEDEAKKSDDMVAGLGKLLDAQEKLTALISDLNDPALDRVSHLSLRTKNLEELVESAQATGKDVLMKYRGLFKELKANDIQGNKMKIVLDEIITPLEDLDSIEFGDGKSKLQNLRQDLDSQGKIPEVRARALKSAPIAAQQLQELIDKVQNILDKMQKQIELNKVIEGLRKVLQDEQRAKEILVKLREIRENQLLDDALKGKDPKP